VLTRTRFLAALGGSVLGLAAAVSIGAGPAAADTGLLLDDSQFDSTASGFPRHDDDCGNAPDQDGWLFIAPANTSFVALTVIFELAGGRGLASQTITLDDLADFGPPDASHAFVFTPAGATLLDGRATVAEDTENGFFALSHTCPAKLPHTGEGFPIGAAATVGFLLLVGGALLRWHELVARAGRLSCPTWWW
jgi:hypothetical protein